MPPGKLLAEMKDLLKMPEKKKMLRILTEMLNGPKLLLWLRFLISFSISASLTVLIRNEFKTLSFRYLPKGFFAFGILDARFELTFTKKILNVSAMEVLFVIRILYL